MKMRFTILSLLAAFFAIGISNAEIITGYDSNNGYKPVQVEAGKYVPGVSLYPENKLGASVFTPSQGGTGIGSTSGGNVGKCLQVSSVSPLIYTFGDCSGGPGGSQTPWTQNINGAGYTLYNTTITSSTINSLTNYVDADAVHFRVKNASGGIITTGTPVYATQWNAAASATEVDLADADNANRMPAFGLAEYTMADGAVGEVRTVGNLDNGVNTNVWSDGTELYVSATAGQLTATRPTGANVLVQKVGRVVRQSATDGRIDIVGAGNYNDIPNSFTTVNVTSTNLNVSGLTVLDGTTVTKLTSTVGMIIGTSPSNKPRLMEITGTDATSFDPGTSTVALVLRNLYSGGVPSRQSDIVFSNTQQDSGNYAAITGLVQGSGAGGQIGSLIFSTKNSLTALLTERMRILSSGLVGIGTGNPSTTLHVVGSGIFTQNLYAQTLTATTSYFNSSTILSLNFGSATGTNLNVTGALNLPAGSVTDAMLASTFLKVESDPIFSAYPALATSSFASLSAFNVYPSIATSSFMSINYYDLWRANSSSYITSDNLKYLSATNTNVTGTVAQFNFTNATGTRLVNGTYIGTTSTITYLNVLRTTSTDLTLGLTGFVYCNGVNSQCTAATTIASSSITGLGSIAAQNSSGLVFTSGTSTNFASSLLSSTVAYFSTSTIRYLNAGSVTSTNLTLLGTFRDSQGGVGSLGQVLVVTTTGGVQWMSTSSLGIQGGGASTFLQLSDTPSSYSGQASKCVAVNGAANALEFVTCGSGGLGLGVNTSTAGYFAYYQSNTSVTGTSYLQLVGDTIEVGTSTPVFWTDMNGSINITQNTGLFWHTGTSTMTNSTTGYGLRDWLGNMQVAAKRETYQNTSTWITISDPDSVGTVQSAGFQCGYSDDNNRVICGNQGWGGTIQLRSRGFGAASQLYRGTTAQAITATTLGGINNAFRGFATHNGLHVILIATTTGSEKTRFKFISSTADVDFSVATNWRTSTIDCFVTSTANIVGAGNGKIYVTSSTNPAVFNRASQVLIPMDLNSYNGTLTCGSPITIANSWMNATTTVVNGTGIVAGWSGTNPPYCRLYDLSGNKVPSVLDHCTATTSVASGPILWASGRTFYGLDGGDAAQLTRMIFK